MTVHPPHQPTEICPRHPRCSQTMLEQPQQTDRPQIVKPGISDKADKLSRRGVDKPCAGTTTSIPQRVSVAATFQPEPVCRNQRSGFVRCFSASRMVRAMTSSFFTPVVTIDAPETRKPLMRDSILSGWSASVRSARQDALLPAAGWPAAFSDNICCRAPVL